MNTHARQTFGPKAVILVAMMSAAVWGEEKLGANRTELKGPSSHTKPQHKDQPAPRAPTFDSPRPTDKVSKPTNKLLVGRIEPMKSKLIEERGGNKESESAIESGLSWLIEHQQQDGSWRFNHVSAPGCGGACLQPGAHEPVDNAATGMALLALLGSGQTHLEGKYRAQISAGLRYLVLQADPRVSLGDLRGTWVSNGCRPMYSQALGTLALSEAYGMTGDVELKPALENSISFIIRAQHDDGGWRYQPLKSGDLSVSGWQMMALESARHAEINFPNKTFNRFEMFLDALERDQGRQYAYRDDDSTVRPAVTATALLSRIWLRHNLGEPARHPVLDDAIGRLVNAPPIKDSLYYDYYASQLFLTYNHPKWPDWNVAMRDFLITIQRKDGHYAGSWNPIDTWGSSVGGRLYNTAIAVMILEVYYRYLPLYQIGER